MFDEITPEEIKAGRKALLDGWGSRPNVILVKAQGAKVWDIQGKEYIDCTSQAWVNNIGGCHPEVIEAVKEQIEKLSHAWYSWDTIPLLLLCKKLAEIAPGNLNKVNLCLDGSLAVESAMKLAMKNKLGRKYFIVMNSGYHGRSLATLATSWVDPQIFSAFPHYMENALRVPEAYCYRCPLGLEYPQCNLRCTKCLENTITKGANGGVIAVMVEPIQGNGTQLSFPLEWHKRVKEICVRHEVLLIWDEVQTGFGRVGKMFAAELYGITPDILVFGKGVGGGFPLAGIIADEALRGYDAGENAFTFGHSPSSLVAALANIKVLEEGILLKRCGELNEYIINRLLEMQRKYEIIGDIRGPGLAIGVELVKDRESKEPAIEEAAKIAQMAFTKGVIFGVSKYADMGHVLKIKPPLVITDEEVEKVLKVFEKCISRVSNHLSS